MMDIFLNLINAISDGRFFLLPILTIIVFAMLARLIISIVQDEIEEFRRG